MDMRDIYRRGPPYFGPFGDEEAGPPPSPMTPAAPVASGPQTLEMRDIYRSGPPYFGPFTEEQPAAPPLTTPPTEAPTPPTNRGPLGMPYSAYQQEPAANGPTSYAEIVKRYPASPTPYSESADAAATAATPPSGAVSPEVADYVTRWLGQSSGDSSPVNRPAAVAPQQGREDDEIAEAKGGVVDSEAVEGEEDPNKTLKYLDAIFSGLAGKGYDSGYWQGLDQRRMQLADKTKKEALEAQSRDPNSPMSRARQLMYRDYLRKSGLSDQEISQLTAADLDKYKPGASVDPMMMELRKRGLELREKGLETAAEKEKRLGEQWQEMNTPGTESAQRAEQIAVRGGLDPEVARGKTATELARLSSAVNEYFKNTGAIGQARTGQAARTAGAVVEAQMPGKVETAYKTAEAMQPLELEKIRAAQTAKIEGEREAYDKPVPGLVIEDADAFRNASGDEVTRRKISDSAGAYRTLMTSLDRMGKLRSKYGAELPGEVQGEYEMNKTLAIGAITTLGQTGVLNEGEYQRYSKSIPSITPSLLDVGNLIGQDLKGDQIRGVTRALRDTVDAKLYQWGARYDYDSLPGAQPKPPKSAGKPQRRAPSGRGELPPGAGPGDEGAPAVKSIGKRGGKDVRAVKTGTAPDGKRVRVIFYVDGSQEVVSG